MGVSKRRGKIKTKNSKLNTREHRLGHYLIVTDTDETEKLYFEGLHNSFPKELYDNLHISVQKTGTYTLIDKCKELQASSAQYREVWIVVDRDEVKDFDNMVQTAIKNNINIAWSNPCIELWFIAHFGVLPCFYDSKNCIKHFNDNFYKKHMKKDYNKIDENIYRFLNTFGDEKKAINNCKRKHQELLSDKIQLPSKMKSCTTMYSLIDEIITKINR